MKTFFVTKILTLHVEVEADNEGEAMVKADDIHDRLWNLIDCEVYALERGA